jgi:small subunit ribosomal protein S13
MYNFRVTNLNLNKELSIALKNIYGLSWYKVNFILARLGIPHLFFVDDLNNYYKDILFFYLEFFIVSVARIDRSVSLSIKKLIDIGTYKGNRHSLFLPVHGQRTRTNANTQRSKRRKLEEVNKLNERSRNINSKR